MFISKQRPITIPQWEHQKPAGTLALLWGNAELERPPVAFDSFLAGIGLHDRAYRPLDNLPIGAISEDEWLALVSYAETMHTTRPNSNRGGQKTVCMITRMLSPHRWHHRCSSSSQVSARHSC